MIGKDGRVTMNRRKKAGMERKLFGQYLIIVLPGVIIFTIGLIIPLIMSVRYSLTDWDGMDLDKHFVGLDNYVKMFQDREFLDAWWFTIKFTVLNTVIQNIGALLLALALDSGIKAKKNIQNGVFCTMFDQCTGCRLHMDENVCKCASGIK